MHHSLKYVSIPPIPSARVQGPVTMSLQYRIADFKYCISCIHMLIYIKD